MPKQLWPARPVKKDPSPDDFGDPSLEISRIVIAPDGSALFAARLWDMDDFDQEHAVLFRVRDFAEPAERLCAIAKQIMDIELSGGALWVLTEGALHRFALNDLAKPAESIELDGQTQRAFVTLDNGQRYVVGNNINWFDGKTWHTIEAEGEEDEFELLSVAASKDTAIAVGADGTILSLRDGKLTRIDAGVDDRLNSVRVDRDGVVWIAGESGTRLRGSLASIAKIEGEFDGDLNASCELRGGVYWSAASDEGGLYLDKGATLERVFDEVCFELTATDDAIYASSAALVIRFTPSDAQALSVDYDEETSKWTALPAEPIEE
ncbi:MAG: hypothetical protein JNK05_21305 [Myxococcales bacterium]|nr:hypothetical protein [Myxococcales bacterium]